MQQIQVNENKDEDILQQISSQMLAMELNEMHCTVQKEQAANKRIIFFGFQHITFDQFYSHLNEQICLQENEFFKIVLIKIEKKSFLLINSPYSLKSCTYQEQKIMLFTSKINMEQILDTMNKQKVHVVINYQELQGNTEQEKLQNIKDRQLLYFGKITLKEEKISLIAQENENQFSYAYVKNLQSSIQLNKISKIEILTIIFNKDEYINCQLTEDPKIFCYGEISKEIDKDQDQLLSIINNKIKLYQQQLLNLQQIPILEECYQLQMSLGEYLRQLWETLRLYPKPKFSDVWKIVHKINSINMNVGKSINAELKNLNKSRLVQFLDIKNQKFEDLFIKMQFLETYQLKQANEFLTKYHTYLYNDINMSSISIFAIIVDFWNKNFSKLLFSKLFNLYMIAMYLQPLPQQDFETGVFFFGKSRVGKSTILNLIQDPQSLTIKKEINQQCYVIKEEFKTQFKIDHGCMSETQIISGQEIDGIWYFDCPGFDDNISEYQRIAHRMNLYYYLTKTKKVIGFFVMDGSIRDAQIIKDTINPLYELMKDKNQLLQEHEKWLSLILVKIKKNTRADYIKDWQQSFRGQLEGKYSIFKQMYENNNQCVEFYKAKKKYLQNNQQFEALKNNTRLKITDIVQRQLQNNEFKVKFQLILEQNLFIQIQNGIILLYIKVEHILLLLENQLNFYILENQNNVSLKKKRIQDLQLILKEDINENNLQNILYDLHSWTRAIMRNTEDCIYFLVQQISDAATYLRILLYTQNTTITPLKLSTEVIRKKTKKAIQIIHQIETIILVTTNIGKFVLGIFVPNMMLEIRRDSTRYIAPIEQLKNYVLKKKYQEYLEKQ